MGAGSSAFEERCGEGARGLAEEDERRIRRLKRSNEDRGDGGRDGEGSRWLKQPTANPWATSRAYGVTFAVAFEFASAAHPRRANMPLASTVAHLLE